MIPMITRTVMNSSPLVVVEETCAALPLPRRIALLTQTVLQNLAHDTQLFTGDGAALLPLIVCGTIHISRKLCTVN